MRGSLLIKRGIEIVGVLFTAFGSFLTNVAPPEHFKAGFGVAFSVGIASFAAFVILLSLASLPGHAWKGSRRTIWSVIGAGMGLGFVLVAFSYDRHYGEVVFAYPPESGTQELYVRGTVYTPRAAASVQTEPSATPAQLVASFGGVESMPRVWQEQSIRRAEEQLVRHFVLMVALLAGAIFSLVEVLAPRDETSD